MNSLTVYVKIKPDQVEDLRAILKDINGNQNNNKYLHLKNDKLTHCSRWVIVEEEEHGPDPRLLLAVEFDGELDDYLEHQIQITPGLDEIWGHCEGYPGKAGFIDYIRKIAFPTQAFYIAFRDETVASIKSKIAVRQQLEALLDAGGVGFRSVMTVLSRLPRVPGPWRDLRAFVEKTIADFHGAWMALVLAIVKPISQIGQTKAYSRVTSFEDNPLTPRAQKLTNIDGQMVTITTIKPWLYWRVRLAFLVNEFLGKHGWAPGQFADVGTLHSFSWVLIDNNKRLIFLSVFDGSWQNYMGDFIDKIIWALDGVYNNTFGYPKGGMADVLPFQRWILNHQYEPQLLFKSYPDETVLNLIRDRTSNTNLAATLEAGLALDSGKVRETLTAL